MAPFKSTEPAPPPNAEDRVLWDVVEEHLDEAEFCFELFEAQLDHPTLSLADLASGAEARLLAHIDALVVGGEIVVDRLLAAAIEEADPERPARIAATALALMAAARRDRLEPALFHEQYAIRNASVRACALSADADLDRWVSARLDSATETHELQSLLELAARRGIAPRNLVAALQSSDATLVASAARAARFGDRARYLAALENLLEHPDPNVRHAALATTLAANSTRGWAACEAWALDGEAPSPEAMTLYASLGGPSQHAALVRQLTHPGHRCAALFALGFTGNAALVPVLLEALHGAEPREAKLAAQAIATITGLDLERDEFVRVPAPASASVPETSPTDDVLPPLDEDLTGDLSLIPEDALPEPDAAAILRWWQAVATRFQAGTRYLAGEPQTSPGVLQYLRRAPLRRRHALAVNHAISVRGSEWLDTRAFTATQSLRLAALAAQPAHHGWR